MQLWATRLNLHNDTESALVPILKLNDLAPHPCMSSQSLFRECSAWPKVLYASSKPRITKLSHAQVLCLWSSAAVWMTCRPSSSKLHWSSSWINCSKSCLCKLLDLSAALGVQEERSGSNLHQDKLQWSLEEEGRRVIQTAADDQRQSTWACDSFVLHCKRASLGMICPGDANIQFVNGKNWKWVNAEGAAISLTMV